MLIGGQMKWGCYLVTFTAVAWKKPCKNLETLNVYEYLVTFKSENLEKVYKFSKIAF